MAKRKGSFFGQSSHPRDEKAREQDVEALLQPRRTILQDIPIDRIRPNPFQARKSFDQIEELAEAIRSQGFVSRLRVRPAPQERGLFQLVYGERRLRAAEMAGLAAVPCEVADHSDEEMIEIGLAENIQRSDLTPLEEAQAFRLFIDQRGYSIRRLAERIGKHKNYVDDRLALLRAPEDVQAMIEERPDALRAAREIAKLDTPAARAPLIDAIVTGELNVHEIRSIVQETSHLSAPPDQAASRDQKRDELGTRTTGAPLRIKRIIQRDLRTCRSIFGRWQASVSDLDEEEQALLAEATAILAEELQALQARLSK